MPPTSRTSGAAVSPKCSMPRVTPPALIAVFIFPTVGPTLFAGAVFRSASHEVRIYRRATAIGFRRSTKWSPASRMSRIRHSVDRYLRIHALPRSTPQKLAPFSGQRRSLRAADVAPVPFRCAPAIGDQRHDEGYGKRDQDDREWHGRDYGGPVQAGDATLDQ